MLTRPGGDYADGADDNSGGGDNDETTENECGRVRWPVQTVGAPSV